MWRYQDLIRSFTGCDLLYSEMLNARIVPCEKPGTSVYLKWTRHRRPHLPDRWAMTLKRCRSLRPSSMDSGPSASTSTWDAGSRRSPVMGGVPGS
ncbi:MAG: hypothetical protein MZU95_09760 [Desulfomicrobium escambiense]|nr:hypothetical protein [Desulfomicrobium escambiense]